MLATAIATAATPLIEKLVENIIVPKIERLASQCRLELQQRLFLDREHFIEYLGRTYAKHSTINLLVCNNEQRQLTDIYIPLALSRERQEEGEKTVINGFPKALVEQYSKLLITDTAGIGKSTITKRMFLDVIDNGHGMPVYIELRRLSASKTILDDIKEQMNALNKDFDNRLLLNLIKTGGFVFFLDGYGEIPLAQRARVTDDIQDFVSKAGNNSFIMTSRDEKALASFGDFQNFSIERLSREEAFGLLRKYDNNGAVSQALIKELKDRRHSMVWEFLKNPLLVSLLFASFQYKQVIPLKKATFYRQVYEAFFENHDLSKGGSYIHEKRSCLAMDEFERVLRQIGFMCLQKHMVSLEKTELLMMIEEARKRCVNLDFQPSDFLADLTTSVPLFCIDGVQYRWAHKSLQEYFAAQFILVDAKASQDKILAALYQSEDLAQYLNVLDIYHDLDIVGFERNIIKPIYEECAAQYWRLYAMRPHLIDEQAVKERIPLLCLYDTHAMRRTKDGNKDENEGESELEQFFRKYQEMTGHPSRQGVIGSKVFVGVHCSPKVSLLRIYSRPQEKPACKRPFDREESFDFLDTAITHMTIDTGCESTERYDQFTRLMRYGLGRHPIILDIEQCQHEISRIDAMAAQLSNPNELLAGL